MSGLLFILALLSLPIFTLYGFISFLKLFFGGSTPNQNQLLSEFIADLELIREKKTTVANLLAKYKSRVVGAPIQPAPPIEVQPQTAQLTPAPVISTPAVAETDKTSIGEDVENWWENWYQDNNINLLLYIGSFLIVSSAAIFVGFNWESFTGTFKAFVLSAITLTFFLSGFFFFFQTPKLRNAGSTFLAIGSLLIPFNGLAWYNFVFRDIDVSFGAVWLVTSLVAATTYFILAILIKNRFYTYIAGLGSLSLIEALVNISALDARYYILGGIFSAFTLLAGSKLIATTKKEEFDKLYSEPLNISSQVTMPIFLVWGLSVASTQDQLFTIEATLSTFLACLFYLITFTLKKNMVFLVLTELLLAMSLVLGLKTFNHDGQIVYFAIFILCFVYQLLALLGKKMQEGGEGYYTIFTAIFISLLALPFAFVDPLINSEQQVLFTVTVSFLAAVAAFVSRQPTYLYLCIGGLDLTAFVYVNSVLGKTDLYNNLGLVYFAFAALLIVPSLLKSWINDNWKQVLLYGSYFNLLLTLTFNLNSPSNLLLLALLVLAIGTVSRFINGKSEPVFSPLSATSLAVFSVFLAFLLPEHTAKEQIYFSTIAAGVAFISTYLEKRPEYLYVAFAGLDLAAFLQVSDLQVGRKASNYLSLTYLSLGVAQYAAGVFTWKNLQKWTGHLLVFTAINFLLALGFALPSEGYSLVVSATIALVAFTGVYFLQKEEAGYIGAIFTVVTVFNIFRFVDITTDFYPLSFVVLSYAFYFSSYSSLPNLYNKVLKHSGLILGVINPIVFGIYSQNKGSDYYYDGYQYRESVVSNGLEMFSLISAYLTTLMLSIEAYRSKLVQLGYLASVVGLVSVLWHYKFINFDELQIYSITTAVYLFIIGYTRERFGKKEERQTFDYAGLAILLLPALWQALPDSGFWYALLLGIEGLFLLIAGLSLNHKTFTYAGVAAIAVATLTRVYSFIASLGSWAIIGSLGLIFLAVAIFLLNKRKLD